MAARARDRWDSLLRHHAERYHLDWQLLKAQMLAESAGNPEAVSPVGARGLAQFMPATWCEWWDEKVGIAGPPPTANALDPDAALGAMAAYLAWLTEQLRPLAGPSDLQDAVFAAYNWGLGRVRHHLRHYHRIERKALPAETQGYLSRIARLWAEERSRSTLRSA